RENEQVDRIGEQRKANDHLEGAGTQDQPDAGGGQQADGERQDCFHYAPPAVPVAATASPAFAARLGAARWPRVDRRASAPRIRPVAPTTRRATPMSNSSALATGIFPRTGRSA